MSGAAPTKRAALLLAAISVTVLLLPIGLCALSALVLLGASIADLRALRAAPRLSRELPSLLSRGVPAKLEAHCAAPAARLRQVTAPDIALDPQEGIGRLTASIVARRRGRHMLPGLAARNVGPLGLATRDMRAREPAELRVYPDMPAARRLALAVRQGRFREQGQLTRGPLGLGTDFESIREYVPDDDIRQVNWRATARLGRPMSNQYRIEQDREVVCLLDTGRLMTAPLGDRTRLDAAVDAVTALALVADELGDRFGVVAFDTEIRRSMRPRRAAGRAVIEAIFDIEPRALDSDYELAFRSIASSKRALVVVLSDLLDEAAARSLLNAVPVLARRHSVLVASAADPDLERVLRREPAAALEVYEVAAALSVVGGRRRVVAALGRAGAEVVEALPEQLSAACVRAYLRAKARARI